MHLEVHPEQLLGHGGALDVPARAPLAPRRAPGRVLALLRGLPEREVLRRALERGSVVALALPHLLRRPVGELAVVPEALNAEVHVPTGLVGVSGLHQVGDQRDDRIDRLARLRLAVGPPEPETIRVLHVGGGHRPRELLAGHALLARGVVDLVVHVGDVHHERRVIALVLQEAAQQREQHVGPRVAHVYAPVHGRAAGVDAHARRVARLDRADLARQGVV